MTGTDDQLEILLLGVDDPLARGAAALARVLAAFAAAPALKPELVRIGKRREPLTDKSLAKALASERIGETSFLYLGRQSAPGVEYHFTFVPDDPIGLRLLAKLPLSSFGDADGEATLADQVVKLMRELASAVTPVYGYAHSFADRLLGDDPNAGDPAAEKIVYEAYWLNLYGSAMAERVGRERLRSVPCAWLEWIDDGACLFATRPGPADFATGAARAAQAAAFAHLRPDCDRLARLKELERRSAELTPVAIAFDADVADVLERMLDTVDVAHRPAEIARLNAYRPPPVGERRPAAESPPADVARPDEEIERYRDRYAEQLVALLHPEIPAIVDGSPDVLPAVDFHFWRSDYPRLFKRADIDNDLVPAVGAFLGEMLVRHLGGRWIPRRNRDETSVVIGDQAWLPFLRARHYLATREAALDCSLTQLYRVAARAR